MDAWVTILTALLAAIVGGWVGASSQFRTERRLRSLDLIWDFRLYLEKTQRTIWDEQDEWPKYEERVHWVKVAASDPRINLDSEKVEAFLKAVKTAKQAFDGDDIDLDNPSPEVYFKGKAFLEEVDRAREALDKLAIERLRKLA
jgi:hypothetical protein